MPLYRGEGLARRDDETTGTPLPGNHGKTPPSSSGRRGGSRRLLGGGASRLSGAGDYVIKKEAEKKKESVMDLKLDEQKLLGEFRRLHAAGKAELLDYAAFLVRKYQEVPAEEGKAPENQCRIKKQADARPEAAKEPIFTE
jgi:hypothetical protein